MPASHPLLDALQASVALEILAQRDMGPAERVELARAQADALQIGADTAQFGAHGNKQAQSEGAAYFAALTRVLAAMAYQPGGVTFAGLHWCADHAACQGAAAYAAANPGLVPQQSECGDGYGSTHARRPVETVAVAGGVL